MKTRRGFTLIEFLVVIAVAAILVAILLPVFFGAASKSRQASCQASMRSLGVAVKVYCGEHDGRLPPTPEDLSWAAVYLKPEQLKWTKCPEFFISAEPESGRGFGFNLKFSSPPKVKAEVKAYLWDGDDCKSQEPQGVFDPNLQVHVAQWVEYRHKGIANVAYFDGHVKAYRRGTPEPAVFLP